MFRWCRPTLDTHDGDTDRGGGLQRSEKSGSACRKKWWEAGIVRIFFGVKTSITGQDGRNRIVLFVSPHLCGH